MPYIHGKSIIKIAVADDHEMFRELISAHIDTIENCKVVIQASNGLELLEKIEHKQNTDIVLLDICMPEMNGYEAAKNLRLKFPDIKILFCSNYDGELAFCRMIGSGGNGYINKAASLSELKNSIFDIMRNGNCYPFSKSKHSYHPDTNNGKKWLNGNYNLTNKELQFLNLICTEKTYKQIAAEMKLNERQVDYIREGLFLRFDVCSRIGLAFYTYNSGIHQKEFA